MEKDLPNPLPEIIFSSSDSKLSKQISQLEAQGKLRRLARRVYTSNFDESDKDIVWRNLFWILAKLYPGALLSHRTALEFKPTSAGHVFMTYTYTKKLHLPGIVLRVMEGNPPLDGDNRFSGELFVSQDARAFLENLQESRQRGPESKTVALPILEDYSYSGRRWTQCAARSSQADCPRARYAKRI
jgi:hypothetical protein